MRVRLASGGLAMVALCVIVVVSLPGPKTRRAEGTSDIGARRWLLDSAEVTPTPMPLRDEEPVVTPSVEAMARQSDVIVIGRVSETSSSWNSQHTLIFTRVTIQVEDSVQGGAAREVVLKELGGTVDEITQVLSTGARYEPGERVLVFAKEGRDPGVFATIWGGAGKLALRGEDDGGQVCIRRVDGMPQAAPLADVLSTVSEVISVHGGGRG